MPVVSSPRARTRAARSLPIPATALLGRSRELDELARLLGNVRLLTITGAGGSGKTRLALELARTQSERFADGVAWIDIAPLTDPELIAQQVLNALSIRETPALDLEQLVIESLRDETMLLVLDNCEHLVHACATFAEALLRNCPNVAIVATSREALGIAGEQTWLVPPLSEADAVQLFVERARSALPSFAMNDDATERVKEICARLDRIPLPIELAAARVKVLSVADIAARIRDSFALLSSGSRTLPRHRTIRETIDWSFRLLSEDEQILFRRLAVFRGTFSMAAAEGICSDAPLDEAAVLELLSGLVDKSLVLRIDADGTTRYRLLEIVRQFATEGGDNGAIAERHARYFLDLVETAEPRIFAGAGDAAMMALLDQEIGNIRAAMDWMETSGHAALELRLIYSLHWYWFARAHFHEARTRIQHALERAKDVDSRIRAHGLLAAGNAAVWQADWNALRPLMDEALPIVRQENAPAPLAAALSLLAIGAAFADGKHDEARELFEESKGLARRHGRDIGYALILYWSGLAAQLRDDWSEARVAFEEAEAIGRAHDHKPAIGHSLTVLGWLALHDRNHAEAIATFRRALEVHAAIDDRWGLTQVLEGIGFVLMERGDAEEGVRLLAATEAAWLQLGARPGRHTRFELQKQRWIEEAVGNERLRVHVASGAAMRYEQIVEFARAQAERMDLDRRDRLSSTSDRWVVRALGTLEILQDGEAVGGSASSARARELLLYLLAHPGGATKEQIGAALWPDADAAKVRNNFHVTIHRLRKMLGDADWIVTRGDLYVLDRKQPIDYDAEVFEREVSESLRRAESSPDARARLAEAIERYRGDYYENGPGEWHLEIRERLRDLFGRALAILGRSKMAAGDFRGAASVYDRLIEFDPTDEQAYRNLMTCYAKQGDRGSAGRVYQRLVGTLRRKLDAEPDPATTRLHARIAAGQLE